MASLRYVVLIALVLFAFVQKGTSIQCFACKGEDCVKNITTKVTCSDPTPLCTKLVHPDSEDPVEKGCGATTYCDLYAECETCDGELCNSSSAIIPSVVMISIVTAILAKWM